MIYEGESAVSTSEVGKILNPSSPASQGLGEDIYDWHRLPLWPIKYKGRSQGSEPETLGAQYWVF